MMAAHMGLTPQSLDYSTLFQRVVQSAADLTLEAGSPFVTSESIFPYTYGARYAGEAWLRGGDAAIDRLYDDPPASSLDVMLSSSAPEPVELGPGPAPPEGHQPVMDDVVGAWVLQSLLALHSLSDEETGALLSRSWRGDRFWIYRAPDASVTSAWAVRFGSEQAAVAFGGAFAGYRPPTGQLRVEVVGSSVRVLATEGSDETLDDWSERLALALL
jgi:hypothetical protein